MSQLRRTPRFIFHFSFFISLLTSLLAIVCLGSAPASSLTRFEFSEPHMGTTFTVVLYASSADEAAGAARAAFARVAGLDARLSDYRDDSEAMRVGREAVGAPVRVSDDLYRVLALAQAMSARTNGAFDATVGPLARVWRRARRQGELPDRREVAAAREASGWTLVQLDPHTQAVTVARAGMRFDFGGVAKGYAADQALATIEQAGVARALVAAGGDVAAGAPPPGLPGWQVSIAPFGTGAAAPAGAVTVADAGVSTSGDAEQWLEVDGVRHSHILDPRTGQPLTGHRQATVVARDAATSDMLATALCVLGASEGMPVVEGTPDAAAVFGETDDGRQPTRWTYSRRWSRIP